MTENDSKNIVVAMPPSGFRDFYWRIIKKYNGISVTINDTAENILKKITFYDENSQKIERKLNSNESKNILKMIKEDISYYKTFNKKAMFQVEINGLDIRKNAKKIIGILNIS